MKEDFPLGKIVAELKYCTEFLNVASLTLTYSLVAYFVASDISQYKEMKARIGRWPLIRHWTALPGILPG